MRTPPSPDCDVFFGSNAFVQWANMLENGFYQMSFEYYQQYKALDKLENQLKEAGGDFNITYETLQDPIKCKEIACILRLFPDIYRKMCDIIETL